LFGSCPRHFMPAGPSMAPGGLFFLRWRALQAESRAGAGVGQLRGVRKRGNFSNQRRKAPAI
jgi:hypothetical protein